MRADDASSPPSPLSASPLLATEDLALWPPSPWSAPRRDGGGGGVRVNPLFTILLVSTLAIGLVLFVDVVVILVVTRRARPWKVDGGGCNCNGDSKSGAPMTTSTYGSHCNTSRCSYTGAGKQPI
jgi:hypothetical protein